MENSIDAIRSRCNLALQKYMDNPTDLSPKSQVRILMPIIKQYLSAGLTMTEIAKVLQQQGFRINRWSIARNIKKLQNAPSAREEGKQKEAKPAAVSPAPAPKLAATTPAPAPATPAAQPTAAQKPAPRSPAQPKPLPGEPVDPRRPLGCSDELWALSPKIDRILKELPAPDREYPELAKLRWWQDSSGKRWDVRGDEEPQSEPDRTAFVRARAVYNANRRTLMEKWGLAQIINGEMIPRYRIAEAYLQPLTVDLDEIIARHLD